MTIKQRITPEQLNELTNEQKDKLRDWWEPRKHDVYAYQGIGEYVVFRSWDEPIGRVIQHYFMLDGYHPIDPWRHIHYKERCLPLMSIGQMIEFISENSSIFNIHRYEDINGITLCDALWEIVKKTL